MTAIIPLSAYEQKKVRRRKLLYICNSDYSGLSGRGRFIVDGLRARGWSVFFRTAALDHTNLERAGFDVVFVDEQISSGQVGTEMNGYRLPLITNELGLGDDWGIITNTANATYSARGFHYLLSDEDQPSLDVRDYIKRTPPWALITDASNAQNFWGYTNPPNAGVKVFLTTSASRSEVIGYMLPRRVNGVGTRMILGIAEAFNETNARDIGLLLLLDALDMAIADHYGEEQGNQHLFFETAAGGGVTVTVGELVQAQATDAPSIAQDHQLDVFADVNQAQAIDAPTMSQDHQLEAGELDQAQAIDAPTIVVTGAVTPSELAQLQALEAVFVTQDHQLAAVDIAQLQSVDAVLLEVDGTLNPTALSQIQALEAVVITQDHQLEAGELVQVQVIGGGTVSIPTDYIAPGRSLIVAKRERALLIAKRLRAYKVER